MAKGYLKRIGVHLTAEGAQEYISNLENAQRATRMMVQQTKVAMAELNSSASATERFETKLRGLKAQLTSYQNQMKAIGASQKKLRQQIDTTSSELEEKYNAINKVKNALNPLQSEYKELNQSINRMKQAVKEANQELKNNRSQYQMHKAKVSQLKNEINQLEQEYEEQAQAVDKAEKALRDYNNSSSRTAHGVKQLENALAKEENALEVINQELQAHKRHLLSAENARDKYNQATKESNVKHKQMKAELEQMNNQLLTLKKTLDPLNNEYNELSSSIARAEKSLSGMRDALNDGEFDMNKLRISIGKTKQEMEELQNAFIKGGGIWTGATQRLDKWGDSLYRAGYRMRDIGQHLTTNLTLPLTMMGTAALKTGIEFEKQMSRVAAISGATSAEVKLLTEQAKDLGASTIFSAREVAQGMEDMATAGFNATEIMSAMPGVLDLAAVSGGDVARASEIAATSIRAFGLEASDASRVADVLAKASADTNAEVADMGLAFQYVAPQAASLGLSIEETAAAIGVLSDAGIKGTKAGTTLRAAMAALAKPTSQSAKMMEQLGFSAFDANGKMKPLPQLMKELSGSMSGLTDQQKQQALATIFGRTALAGMTVLAEDAGTKLGALTESFKNSQGAARQLADTINDNTAGSIEEMMGALETLAITVSETLAPVVTKIAKKLTDLANKFSELSTEQQLSIIKWLGLAAVAGPTLELLGNGSIIFGSLSKMLSKATGTLGGLVTKGLIGANVIQSVGTAGETAVVGTGKFAEALSKVGGYKGLGSVILAGMKAHPIILGLGVALAGGAVVWKLWGQEAYEASQRTKRFGTEVSEATANAVTSMQDMSVGMENAFSQMGTNSSEALTSIQENFKQFSDETTNAVKASTDEWINTIDQMPPEVQRILADARQRAVAEGEGIQQDIQAITEQANQIFANAVEENRGLTEAEIEIVRGLYEQLSNIRLEAMAKNKAEEEAARAELGKNMDSWSSEQLRKRRKFLQEESKAMKESYQEQSQLLEDQLTRNKITQTEYNQAMKALNESSRQSMTSLMEDAIQLAGKTGKSFTNITQDLKALGIDYKELANSSDESMARISAAFILAGRDMGLSNEQIQRDLERMGLSFEQGSKHIESSAKRMKESVVSSVEGLTGEALNATNAWNQLILDEKTGEVRTNLKEFLAETAQSEEGWNQLLFISKNANLNSNAKKAITEAVASNEIWGNLTFEEIHAVIHSDAGKATQEVLEANGLWNSLSFDEKVMLTKTNAGEMIMQAMQSVGAWDSLSPETKLFLVQTNADEAVSELISAHNLWGSTEFVDKVAKIDTNSPMALAEFMALVEEWTGADLEIKDGKIVIKQEGAREVSDEIKKLKDQAEQIPEHIQTRIEGDTNLDELQPSIEDYINATEKAQGEKSSIFNAQSNADEESLSVDMWNEALGDTFPIMTSTLLTKIPGIETALTNVRDWVTGLFNTPEVKASTVHTSTNAPATTQQLGNMNYQADLASMKSPYIGTSTNAPSTDYSLSLMNYQADIASGKAPFISTGTNAYATTGALSGTNFQADILNGKAPFVSVSDNASGTRGNLSSASASADMLNAKSPYVSVSDNSSGTRSNLDNTTSSAQNLDSQSPYVPVSDNSSGTKSNLDSTTSSAQRLDSQSPFINTQTNASHARSLVEGAINAAKNVTHTITTYVKQIFSNRTGTRNFEGGLTYLGDGGRREPYLTPSGQFGVSGNRDEIHDLPKGTKIFPSRQAFRTAAKSNSNYRKYLPFLPKFAKGGRIENPYEGYMGLVGEAGPELFQIANGKVNITPISNSQRTQVLEAHSGQNVDMSETNELLKQILGAVLQGKILQVDGEVLGRTAYDTVDTLMQNSYNRNKIMGV